MFERRKDEQGRSRVDVIERVGGYRASGADELTREAADWLLTRLERWHDERERHP